MSPKLSRREFLRRAGLGLAAGAAALTGTPARAASGPSPALPSKGEGEGGVFQPALPHRNYLPTISSQPADVVRIHAADATNWDFGSDWYGNYVNQTRVNEMTERGLRQITGAESAGGAWARLMPNYHPGQKIAIKVNLNNASKEDGDNIIDALPQVVIALLRTLVMDYHVAEADIWVYDAQRPMPWRFYNPIHTAFPQVGLYDNGNGYGVKATFNQADPSLRVAFSQPNLKGDRWLTDLLFQATYLINLPIMKKHASHPVTLGFKNHFGSLSYLQTIVDANDNPHPYITPSNPLYNPNTLPFVDINANPNIRNKTVLTLADGLFGSSAVAVAPQAWTHTFAGKSPNSLLFSTDPVAIDCVLTDLLRAEFGFTNPAFPPVFAHEDLAYDYLKDASNRGMGKWEKGDPWGAGYNKIRYQVVEM